MARKNFSSGAPLEDKVGYSRMVKVGNLVLIGGTTSVQPDGSVYGEGDPYGQARYIFQKQIALLKQAGAEAGNVVKVEAFLVHMADAAEVGRAYSEFFRDVRPLCTMVGVSELNRPAQLCEIEITAALEG
ncbi:MAG: Rid family hydrolase [Oscillospiraceae bacterium]|jgi:enamine deaminase RidA (YjgF/YER057c/UK114 family)|nr:Rid family hydrolase [Oscillospiraceae bacterium]MCI1990846.1 Rid family hydrolase [Oscillospiraceae bacterium]MCI2035109.1 Rid family hydrolase [Oscillospiraceae bacterium]